MHGSTCFAAETYFGGIGLGDVRELASFRSRLVGCFSRSSFPLFQARFSATKCSAPDELSACRH